MNLIPWRKERDRGSLAAYEPISALWNEMDRLFDRAFGPDSWPGGGWLPAVDVSESEKDLTIRAEIPGVDPKDLDVAVSGDSLLISGEKRQEEEQKGRGFYRSERHYGSFRRQVPLPRGVDPDSISAEYKNGVLTVTLRKDEKLLPKRVPVKAALGHK